MDSMDLPVSFLGSKSFLASVQGEPQTVVTEQVTTVTEDAPGEFTVETQQENVTPTGTEAQVSSSTVCLRNRDFLLYGQSRTISKTMLNSANEH